MPAFTGTIDEHLMQQIKDLQFYRNSRLMNEHGASHPGNQLKVQIQEETKWNLSANPVTNWTSEWPLDMTSVEQEALEPVVREAIKTAKKEAIKTVKRRWIEQGIWRKGWDALVEGYCMNIGGGWKHEEPLELEFESESDTDPKPRVTFSSLAQHQLPNPRRPKSDDEKRQIAERKIKRERDREREASRPYHQFLYQISTERERILNESASEDEEGLDAPHINTMAYENVKNIWTVHSIWNIRWGILPGMLWKHEEPPEEDNTDYLALAQADLPVIEAVISHPNIFAMG